MSRMAAKFNNPSAASTSTNPPQNVKHKKFCTKGEEFYDFLKALGYQPTSKHQKYEHFEYLFQDDKSISFVRKLMSSLKTQHCLLPEEIQRFETLKSQGFVLYGAELEEAIQRRHAIHELYSQQKHKKIAKKEELEKELEVKISEKEKLIELEAAFKKEVSKWHAKETKVHSVLAVIQRLAEESEKEVEIDIKLLNEKSSELEDNVLKLKKDLSVDQPEKNHAQYLCQIDAIRILEKEEKLFDKTQELVRKHGAPLIIKDAGYGVEGDPLNSVNIRKICFQFEKDFDRLKHCIIYEKVHQISLELSLAGQQGGFEKFQDCHKRATQLSAFEYETRAKLQQETRDSINNLTISFQKESEELLDRVREWTLKAVNHQFSALTNIKARSKKKLQEFFVLVTNVLKAQKVRMSLVRNLIKTEGRLYDRLLKNIEQNLAASTAHSKAILSHEKMQYNGPTLEGQILSFVLTQVGITEPTNSNVLSSISDVEAVVRRILSRIDCAYWSSIEAKNCQIQNDFKQFCKIHEALVHVHESVITPTKEGAKAHNMSEVEDQSKALAGKLKHLQQSRSALIKDNLKLREANLEKMKDILRCQTSNRSSMVPSSSSTQKKPTVKEV